jgi:hypothetical protein
MPRARCPNCVATGAGGAGRQAKNDPSTVAPTRHLQLPGVATGPLAEPGIVPLVQDTPARDGNVIHVRAKPLPKIIIEEPTPDVLLRMMALGLPVHAQPEVRP